MHTMIRWLAALALAITFCGNLVRGQGATAARTPSAGCRSALTFFGSSVACYTAAHAGEAAARLPVRAIDPRAAVAAISTLPLLQALVVRQASGGVQGRVTALAYLFGRLPSRGALACPGTIGPRYLLIEETPGRSGTAAVGTICPGLWQGDAPGRSLSLHVVTNLSRAVVAALLSRLLHAPSTNASPVAASSTPTPTPAFPTSGGGNAGPPAVIGPPPPPSTLSVPPPGLGRLITEADDRGTIALNVGDRVLLALDGPYTWKVTVADPSVLAQADDPTPPGSQGIFQALAVGQTTLTAVGSPICPPGQACAQLVRVFNLALVVGGPAPSPTATDSPTSLPGTQLTITQADNGRTISLAVGDRVLLDLGGSLNWNVRIDNPAVLAPLPDNPPMPSPSIGVAPPVPAAQGIFEARAGGTATLTATGTPICLPDQACPQFLVLFKVTFVVEDTPPTPTSTPTPSTQRTITLADNGQTIPLAVGDRFLLELGGTYTWKVQIADPSVIAQLPTPLSPINSQGLFEAVGPGTTTLTAFGDPPCRSLQPACGLPSLVFRLTLVVDGGPPPPQRTITLADNGQTVQLVVGGRFLLDLGGGYTWSLQIADPSVVSRVISVLPIRGAQGLFEARSVGTTTLIATGGYPCQQATPPCELASIRFQITLIVGGGSPQTITQADNGRTITLAVGNRFLLALGGTILWSVRVDDPSVVSVVSGVASSGGSAGTTPPNGSAGAVPSGGSAGTTPPNGSAVAMPPYGAQGLFEAKQPGQTTLRAVGTPYCPGTQACPALAAVFSVSLVVR